MKLTVVITCRDDRRIVDAVRSIDADVEILIVLNGSPAGFEDWLRSQLGARPRIETLERPNRARSADHGIRSASNERVLLMDSDCVFQPGSVAAVARAFEHGVPDEEVYKGEILYEPGPTRLGAIIASSRAQRNRQLSAYKPALAFSRGLRGRLGGHFFDPRLVWKSDAELDARIRRAGLRLVAVAGCVVRHAPLSLRSDLYSSFHYGVGAAIASHLGLELPKAQRSVAAAWTQGGAGPASYLLASNAVRAAGRAYARLRLGASAGRWLEEVSGR